MSNTKEALTKATAKEAPFKLKINDKTVLSSGSTLFNLTSTGRADAGLVKGGFHFFVGDSSAGKTFIGLTCLAEASQNVNFDDYDFIFDNNEDGAHFDMEFYFGKKAASRIVAPPDGISHTVEDFYDNINDAFINKTGGSRTPRGGKSKKKVTGHNKPFIYILDSENGLSSNYEEEKQQEAKEGRAKGKDTAGSYGDGKAKIHSENLRSVKKKLADNGCILIVLSQTRDNINAGMFESKKTRSGGHSLTFYADIEAWVAVATQLTKEVKGKKRKIGTISRFKFMKNRFTGNKGMADVPIYRKFGLDDIGSCIDYLVEEKHWGKSGQTIDADDLEFEGTRKKLIQYIEENDLQDELRECVQDCWDTIEEEIGKDFEDRKRPYA